MPLPVPLVPFVIVSHDAELVAVHGHTEGNVTKTDPWPPLALTVADTGIIVVVQTTPACVTVNV